MLQAAVAGLALTFECELPEGGLNEDPFAARRAPFWHFVTHKMEEFVSSRVRFWGRFGLARSMRTTFCMLP